jgi:hypothetical protein
MPDTKKEWSFLKKRTKKLLLPGLLTLICAAPELGVVTLTTQPGSALEATAKKLVASDLKQSRSDGDPPLMLVGSARLATSPGPAALFVQVQSASFCGSAGCSTSIYLKRGKTWKKVMDSISGPISVAATTHHGMHDLMLHGGDRWVWTGSTYADTLPTPNIDLRHSTKE